MGGQARHQVIPPSWYIAGGLGLALAASGFALYDAIEDKGQLRAEIASKQAEVDRLAATLRAQEHEARVRQSITDAADRAVVAVTTARDQVQTRVVTIVREIARAPDARDPVGPAIGLAIERLRGLDAIDRDRHEGGGAGAADGAAGRPGAAPGAR